MAWIPEEKGSWALPLRHDRITSHKTPITRAVLQLKQVCRHLQERPITWWDSEYGCANFVKLTAEINADKLMRLRPNRCIFIEHWNCFVKQRLHWTKAKLGTTQKGEKWSHLMPIKTWQLWLARDIIEDSPLPWQET